MHSASGDTLQVDSYPQFDSAGNEQLLLVRQSLDTAGSLRAEAMVLDADGAVLWGGFGDGRDLYTDRELSFLTNSRFEGCFLTQAPFPGNSAAGSCCESGNSAKRNICAAMRMPSEVSCSFCRCSLRSRRWRSGFYGAGLQSRCAVWTMRSSHRQTAIAGGPADVAARGKSGTSPRALTGSPTSWKQAKRNAAVLMPHGRR